MLSVPRTHPRRILAPLLLLALCLPAPRIGAQTGASPSSPLPPPPVDLSVGFDTRIREEHLLNLLDFDAHGGPGDSRLTLSSDSQYFRVRHRLWGQLKLKSGPRLFSRFTTEWRRYVNPWLWNPGTGNQTEVILDHFYLDVPTLPYLPASLRLGRQDIVRGEGFLLMDGGPLDGSRSIYQNAILLGLDGQKLGLGKTRIELMGIRNLAWDRFALVNGPSAKDRAAGKRKMIERDQTAFGLYVTQTDLPTKTTESYYFYKEQAPSAGSPRLKLHTIGDRTSGELPYGLRFAAEAAYQFGTHETVSWDDGAPVVTHSYDHRSFGGYAWLSRSFMVMLQPTVKVGAIYLSGDDPVDATDQGWDPLFSRWPEWSELYIYTLIAEGRGVAYWTNLRSLNASLTVRLAGSTKLSYSYYSLRAPESLAPGQSSFFGTGHARGSNHQWLVTADLSRHVSGHFLIERFVPGSFYGVREEDVDFVPWPRQDDAYFIRGELMLKY